MRADGRSSHAATHNPGGSSRRDANVPARNRQHRDAPDLCVEVLSPSTAATDRGKKMQMFVRYRVREYWIVDPVARTVEIYELSADGYELRLNASGSQTISSSTLPG